MQQRENAPPIRDAVEAQPTLECGDLSPLFRTPTLAFRPCIGTRPGRDAEKRRRVAALQMASVALVLWPQPAHAMHLSEGILPGDWAGLWFLVAAPFVGWGLHTIRRRRAIDPRSMALVALVGSALFVISCMPVPSPWLGTCAHPCGTGLGALLIGPGPTIVVASIALLLQALFLAHGGLTTLGADVVSMGVVGSLSAYGIFRVLRVVRVPVFVATVVAGVTCDWATYAMTSFQLATALHGDGSMWGMFAAVAAAFVPTQLPLGVGEGLLTALAYRYVLARRPQLLDPVPSLPDVAGSEAGSNDS